MCWAQDYSNTSIVTNEYMWCEECVECDPQVMNNMTDYEHLLSHEVMSTACFPSSSCHELLINVTIPAPDWNTICTVYPLPAESHFL